MPPTPWSPGSRHTGPGLTDNLKSEFWQLRGAGGGKQRRLVPRPPPVCTAQTPTGAATADRPVALMFQLLPSPGLSPPRTPTLSPSQETSLRRTLPPPRPPAPMIRPALPSPPSPRRASPSSTPLAPPSLVINTGTTPLAALQVAAKTRSDRAFLAFLAGPEGVRPPCPALGTCTRGSGWTPR